MKHIKRGLILVTLLFAASQWGEAIWILGKAQVAQHLIANAWQTTLHNRDQIKPWSWADIWPVARLQWLPNQPNSKSEISEDLYVLSGAHGEALSFGPGHLHGTATPGTGLSVIAGHRDTHFSFLENTHKGDLIKIQTSKGTWVSYRIQSTEVRHIHKDPLLIDADQKGLLLITCYPFNSLIAGGPYRYMVWATPASSNKDEQKAKQQLAYKSSHKVRF